MANWQLTGCCNPTQYVFIGLYGGYVIFNLVFWTFFFLKPFKMIAVLIHEMCHATACWMTGGKVEGLEVHSNEGGVTKYRGGWQTLITPAGYLGGAFYGGAIVVCSANWLASYIVAGVMIVAFLVAVAKADNWGLRALGLGFAAFVGLFLGLDIANVLPGLKFVTLYLGVFILSFSVYDIYDDTIRRTVDGSDANACFKMYPCLPPVGWGLVWAVVGFSFMPASCYFALVILDSHDGGGDFLVPPVPGAPVLPSPSPPLM